VTAQASHTGRLLRYNPASGRTDELATGMWFANGVALAPDESYAVVAETLHARLLRVWLRGPKARRNTAFAPAQPLAAQGRGAVQTRILRACADVMYKLVMHNSLGPPIGTDQAPEDAQAHARPTCGRHACSAAQSCSGAQNCLARACAVAPGAAGHAVRKQCARSGAEAQTVATALSRRAAPAGGGDRGVLRGAAGAAGRRGPRQQPARRLLVRPRRSPPAWWVLGLGWGRSRSCRQQPGRRLLVRPRRIRLHGGC